MSILHISHLRVWISRNIQPFYKSSPHWNVRSQDSYKNLFSQKFTVCIHCYHYQDSFQLHRTRQPPKDSYPKSLMTIPFPPFFSLSPKAFMNLIIFLCPWPLPTYLPVYLPTYLPIDFPGRRPILLLTYQTPYVSRKHIKSNTSTDYYTTPPFPAQT